MLTNSDSEALKENLTRLQHAESIFGSLDMIINKAMADVKAGVKDDEDRLASDFKKSLEIRSKDEDDRVL